MRRAPAPHGAAVYRNLSRTIEPFLRVRHAAVNCCCGSQHLERRARLIDVAQHGQAHQLVELFQIVARRILRVIGRIHRHRKHRARVDIHRNRLHAQCFIHLRAFSDSTLNRRLNIPVDGQPQCVALLGRNVERNAVRKCPRTRIHLCHDSARLSRQNVVIFQFKPALTFAVYVAKPQHLCQQATHRIPSTGVFVKCYSD